LHNAKTITRKKFPGILLLIETPLAQELEPIATALGTTVGDMVREYAFTLLSQAKQEWVRTELARIAAAEAAEIEALLQQVV
jgi:hypothetical protein